jgi:hypothetical protein
MTGTKYATVAEQGRGWLPNSRLVFHGRTRLWHTWQGLDGGGSALPSSAAVANCHTRPLNCGREAVLQLKLIYHLAAVVIFAVCHVSWAMRTCHVVCAWTAREG